MKINGEVVDAIAKLKGWHYDLTDARFAYKCKETTKKVVNMLIEFIARR